MLRSDILPHSARAWRQGAAPHHFAVIVSLCIHGAAVAGIFAAREATPPAPPVAIAVELVEASVGPRASSAPRDVAAKAQVDVDTAVAGDQVEANRRELAERATPPPPSAPTAPAPVEPVAREPVESQAPFTPPSGATPMRAPRDASPMEAADDGERREVATDEPVEALARFVEIPPAAAAAPEPPLTAADVGRAEVSRETARPLPPLPRAKPPVPTAVTAANATPELTRPSVANPVAMKTAMPRARAERALSGDAGESHEPPISAQRPTTTREEHEERAVATLSRGAPTGEQGAARGHAAGSSPRYDGTDFSNPRPQYPYLARRRGQEGRVTLRVRVTAEGEPMAVSVRTSSGYRLLDEAALEAVRNWHFVPAVRDGKPVAGAVDVPISFKLTER